MGEYTRDPCVFVCTCVCVYVCARASSSLNAAHPSTPALVQIRSLRVFFILSLLPAYAYRLYITIILHVIPIGA